MIKKERGITLIALIITVIVMLILAGVAINVTIGDNGIFKKTADTVIIHENASVYEQLCLKIVDDELGDRIENTQTEKLSKLKSDGYMNEDFSVNANVVTKSSMKTGKGNIGSGDVYVLETLEGNEAEYYLMYYNDKKEKKNLGKVFGVEVLEPSPEDLFYFEPETGRIALKKSLDYYYQSDKVPQIGLKTLVIPSKYQGKPVKEIGGIQHSDEYGKSGTYGIHAKDVEQIIIPDTVTTIGSCAFRDCSNLQQINIPDTVTTIGDTAFYYCSNLQQINMPDTVTTIGRFTFSKCSSLQQINIPNTVTTIGDYTFWDCSSLQQIIIPNTVTTMGTTVFDNWTSAQKIYVPFKEGELPTGWNARWNNGCNAQIIYQE